MKIKQFLNKFWFGTSTINRVYIYSQSNLVEWFEKENIRDHSYLGWGDKNINSFQIQNDSIKIFID